MTKKQLKFKIYQHECVDCGWKIWRDYEIESPVCSKCESTKPPKITEDELIRELIINDTYDPEDYENAKRIAQEIIDGKPLEEIEGLNVSDDLNLRSEPASANLLRGAGFVGGGGDIRICMFSGFLGMLSASATYLSAELKNHYY
jgi:hypothetical protein